MKDAEKSKFSFQGLFSKKSKPSLPDSQSNGNKLKTLTDHTISIKHSTLPLIQIKISPQDLPTFTCGKLLDLAKELVADRTSSQSLEPKAEDITQLITQDRCLSIDYWLTLKEKPVSELPNGILLTTYTKKERNNPICIDDFECLAKIGTGAFASVYLGKNYTSCVSFLISMALNSEAEMEWRVCCDKADREGFA